MNVDIETSTDDEYIDFYVNGYFLCSTKFENLSIEVKGELGITTDEEQQILDNGDN